MKIYRVIVKDNRKDLYSPSYLHDNQGVIVDETEDHIYFKAFRKDIYGKAYISSLDRYVKDDIIIQEVTLNV